MTTPETDPVELLARALDQAGAVLDGPEAHVVTAGRCTSCSAGGDLNGSTSTGGGRSTPPNERRASLRGDRE